MNKSNYYNVNDNILQDGCAVDAKNMQNNSISDYNVYNYFKGNTDECNKFDSKKDITQFMSDTQMHIKDGYGVTNECLVDTDSKLRNDAIWTNSKAKVQLYSRVFQGIPNINHGGLIVPVEDVVKQGEYNDIRKGCDRLSETTFNKFYPLIPCLANNVQNVKHIIPEWRFGGEPTRDYIQQKEFLEANGYVMENKVWKKRIC